MTEQLAGRVALVSGASRGIGRVIAGELASRGAAVALTARDEDALAHVVEELATGDGQVMAVPGDLAHGGVPASIVSRVTAAWGPIEVLVNNAAKAGPTRPVHQTDVADFESTIAVNLVGPFALARAVLPGMIGLGRGSIVNIGSIAGVEAYALRAPYSASKWGLEGLTRTLAAEAGPHGIRVNIVSPGPTEGSRADRVIAARAEAEGRTAEDVREELTGAIPLRRFVTAAEVAKAVAFFAGDESSGITGQSIRVSAGIEI